MTNETETKAEEAQQTIEAQRARLSDAVGKLILASIGAVALGQETLKRMLNRMVERGEQVQAAARQRADELGEKGRHKIAPSKQKVETMLEAARLPSKTDIQSLHDQITALSTKVDHLAEVEANRSTDAQP